MLTDDAIEALRYKGEGSDLDYKAERYKFEKASDEEKSELLKDILAFANAYRDGPAYILIGFKEDLPRQAKVVGLSAAGAIDDSRLQQFVNEKLNKKLEFRYEEGMFKGSHVAVISIPKQQRPFYLKKDFGKLHKNEVYVRRGSSTGIAEPDEIVTMGVLVREKANVALKFMNELNEPLPHEFDRVFLNFPTNLPNMVRQQNMFSINTLPDNRDYYREFATFLAARDRLILSRVVLTNRSDFPLGDVHIEISISCPPGESADLYRADDVPDEPSKTYFPRLGLHEAHRRMTIDDHGVVPVVHIGLGTVRPGQTVRAEEALAVVPSAPGAYSIQARIFANEIPAPMLVERHFQIVGDVFEISEDEFFERIRSIRLENQADR